MASKAPRDSFEDLSLQEVSKALESEKRVLVPSVAFATHLEWRDGIPRIIGTPVKMSESPAERLLEILKVSLDLPYDGNDPSLANLTMGEAMVVQEARKAAHGNSDAFERIMDRIVGPPVQKTQSVNFSGDLTEFLDKVADQTREVIIDVQATDVSDL